MDPLTDVLAVSGARGTVAATVHAGPHWGLAIDDVPGAAFHAVNSGTAWLMLEGQPPRQLVPGDVVLLPIGTRHRLASDPHHPCRPFDHAAARAALSNGGVLPAGEPPRRTRILCASYHLDPATTTPLLTLLPESIQPESDPTNALGDLVRLLGHEIQHPRPAAGTALNRLLDLILIHILRTWLSTADPRTPPSWLSALRDPTMAAALSALHTDPAHAWTVEELATHIAVSRATLARRFTTLVGDTPNNYLTRWRMELAAHRLRTTTDPIAPIAHSVGYTSEHAFNRAFTRAHGHSPGRYRTRHTLGEQPPPSIP
ncbi:AraC family transcriptional regulator [Nocardia bovistercoris]|uniref:AraC family transcriptional regulator n=1 Tax=Nocardia bovistercoris TaxID=2785916 RepID=A0A931IGJ9_9NOCA|nr:AraC family transcriptional regulator [Nocardia bovistercoris]MBH0779365.1 AraC family transcriptional regulator [Nocardia bovistercoris]